MPQALQIIIISLIRSSFTCMVPQWTPLIWSKPRTFIWICHEDTLVTSGNCVWNKILDWNVDSKLEIHSPNWTNNQKAHQALVKSALGQYCYCGLSVNFLLNYGCSWCLLYCAFNVDTCLKRRSFNSRLVNSHVNCIQHLDTWLPDQMPTSWREGWGARGLVSFHRLSYRCIFLFNSIFVFVIIYIFFSAFI